MRYIMKVRGLPPRKWLFFQACSFFLHGRIGDRGAGGKAAVHPPLSGGGRRLGEPSAQKPLWANLAEAA